RVYRYIILVDITSYINKGEKRNAPLLPSEFREGLANTRNINSNFFIEVTNYLWANSLENTLGLKARKMIKFSFNISSLLVKEEVVEVEVREERTRYFIL
ncbi:hypothetical protein BGZ57DRAFT_776640, partial [Hyaloscypha finlandica]